MGFGHWAFVMDVFDSVGERLSFGQWKWGKILPILVAAVVVFGFALFPVTDFDIWFHLAEGKVMVEEGTFPYRDIFSYTAPGAPSYPNSWLFTALAYIAADWWGVDGLNIAKAGVVVLLFLTLCWNLVRRGVYSPPTLLLVILGLFAIREELSLRPHTLAYVLFALFLTCLLEWRVSYSRRFLWALVGLEFLWVNTHASFLWGIVLVFMVVAEEVVKKKALSRESMFLVIGVGVASLAHVWYGPTYFVRIVNDSLSPAAALPIQETFAPTWQSFLSLTGVVLLAGWAAVGWYGRKAKDWAAIAGGLFFTALALWASRFVKDAVIYFIAVAPLFFPRFKIKVPAAAIYIVLLVLFFVAQGSLLGLFRLGLSPFTYPVDAVEFIRSERLLELAGGNLYHTYNFGGYLMWALPEHKVFIDGRGRPYHGDIINRYWSNFEGKEVWRETVEKYDISAALMTLPHMSGGVEYNNSEAMFPKQEWALIYFDDTAALYVRRVPELQETIKKYEYTWLNPQKSDVQYLGQLIKSETDVAEVMAEIDRGLEQHPNSFRLHFTKAYVLSQMGRTAESQAELNAARALNPTLGQ